MSTVSLAPLGWCPDVHNYSTVCTTAFYVPGNLARAMTEFRQASFGARVNTFVKGVRVKTTHLHYKKTVKALSGVNAKQHVFEVAEFGQKMSVEAYFKRSSMNCIIHRHSHLI